MPSKTIYPTVAAVTVEAQPDTNFGDHVNLLVKRTTGSKLGMDRYVAHFNFNLIDEDVPADAIFVNEGTRLYMKVSSIYGYGDTELLLWHHMHANFDEGTITWNSQPVFTGIVWAGWHYPQEAGWFYVEGQGDSYDSIAEILQHGLDNEGGDVRAALWAGECNEEVGFVFDSDDGEDPFYLVVEYTVPPVGVARSQGHVY